MSEVPIQNCLVGELLRQAAAMFPENDAVVSAERGVRWSFQRLDEEADRVARGCIAIGLKPGDRAVVWAPNIPEWLAVQYGLARAGVIMVTANTALKLPEISFILKKSRVRALFFAPGTRDNDFVSTVNRLDRGQLPALELLIGMDGAEVAESTPLDSLRSQGDAVDRSRLDQISGTQQRDDVINMQYTSGTTGFPKGVMLTHRNIVQNAAAMSQVLKYRPGERLCLAVPLFHCFGCVIGTLVAHGAGMALVLNDAFHPDDILDTIEKEQCTRLYGVPTMFVAELAAQRKQPRNLDSLRGGIMAGSTCPEKTVREAVKELQMPELVVAYGLTEASPCVTFSHPEDDLDLRATTVGRALPGVEVRVVDLVSEQDVAQGNAGELWTRGENIMPGYDDDPEATRHAITGDGWLRTGDLAIELENGCYQIVGRIKDLIIRGGENISPMEVEDVLRRHEDVLDVAVFSIESEFFGEEVAAAVRLKKDQVVSEEQLQEFAAQFLSDHKVPARVLFMDEFPLTGSGKIKRYLLKEMAEEL